MVWVFASPNPPRGPAASANIMTVSLQNVIDDILIHILCMLPLKDVLSVRQTSKQLEAITYLRTIWHNQFCFEVLSKGLPIPGTAIPLLGISASDLEWRTRLAVRVQEMWTYPAGPIRPVLHLSVPAAQKAALRIGGRELVTLHSDRFITWRLDSTINNLSTDKIMLEYTLGTDITWKIHKDLGDFDTIAISNDSGDAFVLTGAFDEPPLRRHYPGRIHGLFDQFVLTSIPPESGGIINIYNWVDVSLGIATIQSHPQFFGDLITFAKFDSHLVVFWEACLTIYPIPSLPEAGQFATLNPIQLFFFQFPIQSPVVCSPCTPLNLPNSGFVLSSKLQQTEVLSICYRVSGTGRIRGCILSSGVDSEEANVPLFRLTRSPFVPGGDSVCVRVGHSGRGIWLDSRNDVYRCRTVSIVTSGGDKYSTLEMGHRSLTPLCTLPGILKEPYGDWALDFDEGTGRIVYCNEAGHVSVVDVV